MRHGRTWCALLLLGSVWGLAEVVLGDLDLGRGALGISVWLTVWGLVVLAVGRGVTARAGSATAIGAVATLFRLANTAPNFCHLSGIMALAVTYDVAATLLQERHRLAAAAAAIGSRAVFFGLAAGVWQSPHWLGGWQRAAEHILVGGVVAALLAALLAPAAVALGRGGELLGARHPRLAMVLPTVVAALIWITPMLS